MNMKCRGGPCDGIIVDVHHDQRVVKVPVKKECTCTPGRVTKIPDPIETVIYIMERWKDVGCDGAPFFKLVYGGAG